MTQPHRLSRPDDDSSAEYDCKKYLGQVGDGACDTVLQAICRAANLGVTITIWDLPQVTGLALHEAFAAVRTLEFGRMVRIGDNPSDPFGATLTLVDDGLDRLAELQRA